MHQPQDPRCQASRSSSSSSPPSPAQSLQSTLPQLPSSLGQHAVYRSLSMAAETPLAGFGSFDKAERKPQGLNSLRALEKALPPPRNHAVLPPVPFALLGCLDQTCAVRAEPVEKTVEAIAQTLKALDVDAEYNAAKYKWKCKAYFRNQETAFGVRLYSDGKPGAGTCVLASHRRLGCAMHFSTLLAALRSDLGSRGLAEPSCGPSRGSRVVRGLAALPLPADFCASPAAPGSSADGLRALLAPCFAEYVDVQREALRALANHVGDDPQAAESLVPHVAELVLLLEPGQDGDVRRLAACALASLATPEAAEGIVQNHGLPALSQALVNELECCELRRHVARILQNVCPFFAQRVQDCFGPGALVRCAEATQDERLCTSVKKILTSL
jgi:hypothetical protein